ncbi:MAG TPA: GNAT family N-acetyltransferase [Mycobacteriales bacterium]|nr:GNAT family N-acetyltransferase [Mycobacteriales bacterium]
MTAVDRRHVPAVAVVVDPVISPDLVAEVVDLWVRVTDAGGAVGFTCPTDAATVRPVAETSLGQVAAGHDTFVGLTGENGRLVAWCILEGSPSALRRHWRMVVRVMVDPEVQGARLGSRLMDAAHEVARRDLGLEALVLQVRGGTGVEEFYRRAGYEVVGRIPGAIRLGDGDEDDRDEILMWRSLEA